MTHYILGLDPGANGGAAILRVDGKSATYMTGTRLPKMKLADKTILDTRALLKFLSPYPLMNSAAIEKVSAFGMGRTSAFSFGRSCGALDAIAATHATVVNYVTPQAWKAHHGLLRCTKRDSIDKARSLFPSFALFRLVDDGVAEAALMAMYQHKLEQSK